MHENIMNRGQIWVHYQPHITHPVTKECWLFHLATNRYIFHIDSACNTTQCTHLYQYNAPIYTNTVHPSTHCNITVNHITNSITLTPNSAITIYCHLYGRIVRDRVSRALATSCSALSLSATEKWGWRSPNPPSGGEKGDEWNRGGSPGMGELVEKRPPSRG